MQQSTESARSLMRDSIVLWRLIAFTLWLSVWGSHSVSANGVIAFPPAQYVTSDAAHVSSSNGALRGAASSTLHVSALSGGHETRSGGGGVSKQIARKKIVFDKTASSSMKTTVDKSIPDCGTSRIDIPPVDVAHARRFEWRSLGGFDGPSMGPCEIWIDSERVFEHQNCVKLFEATQTIPFDYSACRGACLLTFYWLLTDKDSAGTEPMKHCVPIRNGEDPTSDSSSKSGSGSKSASASGSSSGSSSPSAASSSSLSGSGSEPDPSNCLFDVDDLHDLYTLGKFYDTTFGFGHHHVERDPVVSQQGIQGPLISSWRRPRFAPPHHHFGRIGYSSTRTKTATEQCQYTATGGFTCSSTETITDSVQPLPGVGARVVRTSDAYEPIHDLHNLHETHGQ